MAMVAVIVKIMPASLDISLDELRKASQTKMEACGAKNISFEEKPIAFGLKALFMKMALPEDKGTDLIEAELSKIDGVSSITLEDYRRAFG